MVIEIHTLFISYNALANVNIDRLWTLPRVNLSFMIPAAIEMITGPEQAKFHWSGQNTVN